MGVNHGSGDVVSAIRRAFLALAFVMTANPSAAQSESRGDWKPMADFESVDAFEKQLSRD